MALNIANALNAYANVAKSGGAMEPRKGLDPAGNFADLVKEATGTAKAAVERSEALGMEALAGKVDMTDVVAAVNNAEIALQTVVAVRDKVITAYQDIIRMPL